MNCPLCAPTAEHVLLERPLWRVIAVHDEANAPAFCRVIWREHTAEMTDLPPARRAELMDAVYRVEAAMRQVLRPAKINLASLGNMVPHLHWHVIARFEDDACFPAPVWAQAVRPHAFKLPENWAEQVKTLLNQSEKEYSCFNAQGGT
ncbi:HIT family protein [Conchiformibius kuhniae]|uniref:HIT family protein n=1 Tax=Conchiformibius kuhniae TaxID=211502 RepID=A0ABD8B7V3_9NEIS|nr:HIT domain-containing protein [Conchiformibius kuhniae]